jgi:benzoate-CoA ligase
VTLDLFGSDVSSNAATYFTCGLKGRFGETKIDDKPLAFVVPRSGVSATPELAAELQQFARSRLAEYKHPRWVEFVDALPTTATGKVQRFKLRARGTEGQSMT